jgi:hypothetical protein
MTLYTRGALLAIAAALLAGCSSSSSSPTPPAAKQLFIAYTAIGADAAVGYGAFIPCTTGNPATATADSTCPEPGASGYVPDMVRGLASAGLTASLQDLGISGAVIGPDLQATANKYGTFGGPTSCVPSAASAVQSNILQGELPKINPAATYITIFTEGNDVNQIVNELACGAGGTTTASQTAFVTQQVTEFGLDFQTLAVGAHKIAPGAIIVAANLPNYANLPYALGLALPLRQARQQISAAIDTNVINTLPALGIPVVDLQCNATAYQISEYALNGYLYNDAGHSLIAQLFLQQTLSNNPAAPQATCSQQALSSGSRR